MPMKLKIMRSVIINRLDKHIHDRSVDEILNEINNNNEFVTVVDIFKFPNSNAIKITCYALG